METTPAVSNAEIIQLGFILDRSCSIGAGNWITTVDGLFLAAGALIPVTEDDQHEMSVCPLRSPPASTSHVCSPPMLYPGLRWRRASSTWVTVATTMQEAHDLWIARQQVDLANVARLEFVAA